MKQIVYQNLLLTILGAMIFPPSPNAQTSSYDGMQVRALEVNRSSYYFGEPFFIYFVIENTSNTAKPYYKPLGTPNLSYELKNKKTGETIERRVFRTVNWPLGPITEKQYIKPNMKGYERAQVGEIYGTILLTGKKVTGDSDIKYHLAAIPLGEYELTLRYALLPSDKVISAKHRFRVIEPPSNLQQVRDQYLKTVYYANETSSNNGNGTYSASHPDSYENFLKKHPDNIFAEYAGIDMTIALYRYPSHLSEEIIKKRKEYLDLFPRIKQNDIKLYYAAYLPSVLNEIVKQQEGKQASRDVLLTKLQQLSEDMLHNKLKDSYYASEVFILSTPSLTGLRNYAVKEK